MWKENTCWSYVGPRSSQSFTWFFAIYYCRKASYSSLRLTTGYTNSSFSFASLMRFYSSYIISLSVRIACDTARGMQQPTSQCFPTLHLDLVKKIGFATLEEHCFPCNSHYTNKNNPPYLSSFSPKICNII